MWVLSSEMNPCFIDADLSKLIKRQRELKKDYFGPIMTEGEADWLLYAGDTLNESSALKPQLGRARRPLRAVAGLDQRVPRSAGD